MTLARASSSPPGRVAVRSTGWWGMVLAVLVLASMLSTLVFATLYLRPRAVDWPPPDVTAPGMLLPGVATAAALLSLVPVVWLHRALRTGSGPRVQAGALAALLVGGAYVGLALVDLWTLEFSVADHAYASLYVVTAGFHLVVAGVGLAFLAALPLHTWTGRLVGRLEVMVANVALYWYYVVAGQAVVFATLHLYPLVW